MKFSTTAGSLREALSTASGAVMANPTMVAYSGILLLVKKGSLSAVGSDGETTIAAILEVSDGQDGQVLLPPKPISTFLSTLPSDTIVEIEAQEHNDAHVHSQNTPPYKFRTIAATFPLPGAAQMQMSPVKFEHLGEAIAAVRSAAGKDEPRVQIVSSDKDLVLHTTDTYRVGKSELKGAGFGDFNGVASLVALERMARHGIDKIGVDPQGRSLRGTGPGVVIMSRLLQSPFPDVSSVLVDQKPERLFDVHVTDVLAGIRRLETIADTAPLQVSVSNQKLVLSVSNIDLGSGEETIALDTPLSIPVEFQVNLAYFRDALDAHASDLVEVGYNGALQPVFFSSQTDMPVTTVVMPIQV